MRKRGKNLTTHRRRSTSRFDFMEAESMLAQSSQMKVDHDELTCSQRQ